MATPRPKPPGMKIVQAAGAVIWRLAEDAQTYAGTSIPKTADDIDVMIVHRPKYNDWSWPKGKREIGEPLIACATREVEEETGLAVRLQTPLTTQRYRLGSRVTKAVYYWVGCLDIGQVAVRGRAPVTPASKREIDEIRWVSPHAALDLLTRRGDRRLLEEVMMKIDSGTLVTTPFIVMRHGKAISRKKWTEGEASRPLSREGVHEIRNCGEIFSAYGVEHLQTSPWRRCLSTAGAYAAVVGADVDIINEATEAAFEDDPNALSEHIRRQLRKVVREPVAFIAHRPTLPAIFDQIMKLTSPLVASKIPNKDPYLVTGEMLVAHVATVPDELLEAADASTRREPRRRRKRIRMTEQRGPKPGPPPGVAVSQHQRPTPTVSEPVRPTPPTPAPPKPGPKVTTRVVAVEMVRP